MNYSVFRHMTVVFFSILNTLFEANWKLLLIYLILNIIDTITGYIKARVTKKENSVAGFKGILKKFYCWVLIFLSFTMAMFFKEVGNIISIDFSISSFLGWYVLITLMINEFRSILENLIEIGCPVPKILITGLEIANNKVQPNDSQSFPTEKSNPK